MLPSFVCFLCCLVVAAFIARAGAVAVLRARQKGATRPAFFPTGWTVVSGLALAIAAVQIGVAVHEMRDLYRIGQLVKVGDTKSHVETVVEPAWRKTNPPEKRAAAEADRDIAETWWVVRHHSALSPIPARKSAWMIGFDDDGRVCRSCRSLAY